jgi:hypothetical protein
MYICTHAKKLGVGTTLSALPHPPLNWKTTNSRRERESRGKQLGRERRKNGREEVNESESDRKRNINTNVV